MKKLIFINGPVGVGKSATCEILYKKINKSVWLDGDWCWMMNPWDFSETNKRMAENNILHLLNNYLENKSFDCVIFSWVMPEERIFDVIIKSLKSREYGLYKISLVCSKEELEKRCRNTGKDERGVKRSQENLKSCANLRTVKIDTTVKTPEEAVKEILKIVNIER